MTAYYLFKNVASLFYWREGIIYLFIILSC